MEVKIQAIADAANVSREGKLNILGEFNTINSKSVPVTWPSMVFVVKVEIGAADGSTFQFEFRVVGDDGNPLGPSFKGEFGTARPDGLPDGQPSNLPMIFPVGLATFPEYGEYTFELWIGGRRIAACPLYVRQAK